MISHSAIFLKISLVFLVILLLIGFLAPLPKEITHKDYSRVIYDKNGDILRVFCTLDDKWRMKASLDDVSPILKKFIINYEDRYFYYHLGVNPASLIRAFLANLRAGRIVQGGSTISMQVVKILYPRRKRTYLNKIKEILLTFLLEFKYSKNEILEMYLNLAPYGSNIEGVRAASLFYFDKIAQELSPGEAAILTMLPKSPTRYRPDRNPEIAGKNRNKVLKILFKKGTISRKESINALKEDIPKKKKQAPFLAPHFTDWIARTSPGKDNIFTTLDLPIQNMCEKVARDYMNGLNNSGITNCAVVVLENETGNLLSMVGSENFFNKINQGQVNGALSPRSPGSLLKPFLYTLAMDKGLIAPQRMLVDVPVSYSGYCPANYDGSYRGIVTARDALRLSLNVPAINLTARLKNEGIYELLKKVKISSINRPQGSYGLSIILGACEISLLDLTTLYSALANYGVYRPPRIFSQDKDMQEQMRLFSPGAAWLITDILTDVKRPDLPKVWKSTIDLPKIAWKTGTSYGHKDAWSIGYNPLYTVGVWVGNFDGRGVYELSGSRNAAPLLFKIFNNLCQDKNISWFFKPDEVQEREVCALSGMVANGNCPKTKRDWYLENATPQEKCQVHKSFYTDKKTGMTLCTHCKQGRQYYHKVYEQWPANIATLLTKVGYPVPAIPTHFHGCDYVKGGQRPVIVSPEKHCVYYKGRYLNKEYQKILLAASVQNSVKEVYWFIDDKLLYKGRPEERYFYYPESGKHKIVLMDDEGRTDMSVLEIY